jgi:hypothetical protein
MLESIPDPIKRERRRDVIENGLESYFFKIAVLRMLSFMMIWKRGLQEAPGLWILSTQSPMRR